MIDWAKWRKLKQEDAMALRAAAIVGDEALADEMVRLELADPGEARWIRYEIMEMIEGERDGKNYSEVVDLRILMRVSRAVGWPGRVPEVAELADWLAVAYSEDPATMLPGIAEYPAEDFVEKAKWLCASMLVGRPTGEGDDDGRN